MHVTQIYKYVMQWENDNNSYTLHPNTTSHVSGVLGNRGPTQLCFGLRDEYYYIHVCELRQDLVCYDYSH